MHKAGERQLLAADGSARDVGPLENGDAPPGSRQHGRRDQPVGPGADDDGVGFGDGGGAHNAISMPGPPSR